MKKITDLRDLKTFFKENVETPILGVGVYAFDRLWLEDVLEDYKILALRYSLETELIEKDLEVLSLEKGMGTKHIRQPRNSTTVINHPRTKQYLSKLNRPPLLLPYKASTKMEKICKENGWTLAASPTRFGKKLFENKATFRKILQGLGIDPPPGEIISALRLDFETLRIKYGLPFVIQHPKRGGGKGTFFINSKDDWARAMALLHSREKEGETIKEDLSQTKLIASKYISGSSPSITGCVTRHGTLSTSLQYQIIDAPLLYNPKKGSGLFCGHDWSSSHFSEEVSRQAYDIVEKVGTYFAAQGYKGIFGIDFVLEENSQKLYVTECNPRLLGSFPTIAMIQTLNGETPILAFHVLEHLGADYDIDPKEINELMRRPKFGSQMFLHNLTERWGRNQKEVKPGIYELEKGADGNNTMKFIRPGYAMKHLETENEFLLTDGLLKKHSHFSPNRRLGRILTKGGVLSENKRTLSPWAQDIAAASHSSFQLKPIKFAKITKIINPHFLAKG